MPNTNIITISQKIEDKEDEEDKENIYGGYRELYFRFATYFHSS